MAVMYIRDPVSGEFVPILFSGATGEEIRSAVNEYLERNPVTPGATKEEATQIKENTEAIKRNKEAIDGLTPDAIGALPKNGTAANANQLNGNSAAYYTPYTNLADNSDFTHWVAQAGISALHEVDEIYGGDRWILESGTVTGNANVNGDGYSNITLNGTLVQVVPSPPAVATAFVEMVSGTAKISYDATNGEIIMISAGGVIKNVLLLPGVWTEKPPYVPKGYSAELAECLMYYRQSWEGEISPNAAMSFTHINVNAYSYPLVNWEIPMRATPTVTLYSWNGGAGYIRNWTAGEDVSGVAPSYTSPKGFALSVSSGETFAVNNVYAFHYTAIADL